MAEYPVTKSGVVKVKYPLTRSRKFRTTVLVSIDTSEQRFSKASPVAGFQLSYTNVSLADKNLVRDFFNARQGALDTTWSMTLPDPTPDAPTTYTSLQFLPGQTFEAVESNPGYWSFSLTFRQVNPYTIPA